MTPVTRSNTDVLQTIRSLRRSGKPLNYSAIRKSQGQLLVHARKAFGSWREAVTAAGIDYGQIALIHRWTKPEILDQLRQLHAERKFADLRRLALNFPKLYQACCRHFGAGRAALKAAGINYEALLGEHPYRWTRPQIIAEVQRRHAAGETLCRAEILRSQPRLHRFCYAAMHQFGTWNQTLRAAGLRPQEVRNRDGLWPRERVLAEIRGRYERGKFLNTDLMLRENLPLHAAGRRHFGTWKAAVEKAGIHYGRVRGGLLGWTKTKTRRGLRERLADRRVSEKQLREQAPSLYRAALHHFGSWDLALQDVGKRK